MPPQHSLLNLTFNHVAFPPQLPGKQDPRDEDVNGDLTRRLLDAVKALREHGQSEASPTWNTIEKSLALCTLVNENGHINKARLLKAFKNIQPDHAVILHIVEQNAGVMIRQSESDDKTVIFEAFETSAMAEQTLAARGALQWDFPGVAASLPLDEFQNPSFQENMASFFEKASLELLEEFAPKSRKAGVDVTETRDTVDPAIITQFFMTLVETKGSRVQPKLLRKRVKDDVIWDDSEMPWRRSPFWLLLRVCTQRLLYLRHGASMGRMMYKFLMCSVLSNLLEDVSDVLLPEQGSFLQAKLCRRLAKLDTVKERSDPLLKTHYAQMFKALGPIYQRSIDNMTQVTKSSWNAFKNSVSRKIPRLPKRAGSEDLRLSLPNSGVYLQEIINETQSRRSGHRTTDRKALDQTKGTQQFRDLTARYSLLAQTELAIEAKSRTTPASKGDAVKLCLEYASQIDEYMEMVGDAYGSNPEQMSVFTLTLFELWVHMDKCATVAYPVFREFHPAFNPCLLDILLLSRFIDLERLRRIQSYLHDRCTHATTDMTIFSDPAPGCFADRFFEEERGPFLKLLETQIEAASLASRKDKEDELEKINSEFHDLTERRATSICTERQNEDGTHDIRGCTYCYYLRRRKRLRISIHEDFLPSESKVAERRAVVLELGMPKIVAAYRRTTWEILNTLCPHGEQALKESPECLLGDYAQLIPYNKYNSVKGPSLASHTKSYLGTHYSWKRLPASAKMVLMPMGLQFSYFDTKRNIWMRDLPAPLTFAHHFSIALPANFPLTNLFESGGFAADGPGPSSYEAIASISECPPELTTHEFIAHQSLVAGRSRRWLDILGELGSSNVNFSVQTTCDLMHRLVLQAGPISTDYEGVLRVVHVVFKDLAFCRKLIEKVHQHIEAISANWRETIYMETMLTIAIQLHALGHRELFPDIQALLLRIRRVTLSWVCVLRKETRNAWQIDTAERLARYCFLSALLCRRTFYPHAYNGIPMSGEDFRCFVEATLAMQESLVVDLKRFSTTTKNLLIRDIKMVARMKAVLLSSARINPTSLGAAIDAAWPEASSIPRNYTDWQILPEPYEGWVMSTVQATESVELQEFHHHLLEGHFLINGRALGKLPPDISDSQVLRDLFGNQRLFALPSNMPGMDFTLGIIIKNHQIHIGYRKNTLIVRAVYQGDILELVPRSVFGTTLTPDLPVSMTLDCVHWLNLRLGTIEVRRKPAIWYHRPGNWNIDLRTRTASRRSVSLVDPHSDIFRQVARVFSNFECPPYLTVFQPRKQSLSIEIKRMDLSFHVNNRQLLHCKQLHAEMDLNQDAGTLFGLQSMLVLRNPSQRFIITTMGRIHYERQGMHTLVRMENDGRYARYIIEKELGRLHCPPVPQLLCIKATLHAFTSCMVPDPLTKRTGTEEALLCLQSGCFQPWTPKAASREVLEDLSNLTPRREFYPKDKRAQQKVEWNPHLTTTIQHDAYGPLVASILGKSERLSLFDKQNSTPRTDEPWTSIELRKRAQWRRSIYERPDTIFTQSVTALDLSYNSRDAVFRGQLMIGGYANSFTPHVLQETLNTNLAVEWGGLVNKCKDCHPEDVCDLIFHIGAIAFRNNVDMAIIRVLLAFFFVQGLKELQYPQCTSFEKFELNAQPTSRVLLSLTRPFWTRFEDVWEAKKNGKHVGRDKRRREAAKEDHEMKCEMDHEKLIAFLIRQWPCDRPTSAGFQTVYLDIEKSIDAIAPEWLRLYNNSLFAKHLEDVQKVLDRHSDYQMDFEIIHDSHRSEVFGPNWYPFTIPSLGKELLQRPGPKSKSLEASVGRVKGLAQDWWVAFCNAAGVEVEQQDIPDTTELENIVQNLMRSDCSVRCNYAQDLQKSIATLKSPDRAREQRMRVKSDFKTRILGLKNEILSARRIVSQIHTRISVALSCDYPGAFWLQKANLWPCLSPTAILEHLRSTSSCEFGSNMRPVLISYGMAIAKLQQLLRMQEALQKRDEAKLWQEYRNPGHTNWHPAQYPDWLLLELDANIQIREDQVTVAREIVAPTSGSNSVLQMNMGQGKTSVIMPMVACLLADGKRLTRLIVPKSLLSQTAQTLQSRLGGLVGREVTHVPFSRQTPTTPSHTREYRELHYQMLRKCGIILAVPEHILSFKLSGLQRVSDMKIDEAAEMVAIQNWMGKACRDILDECDFTLAVKTQLIYPSGSQLTVDGHPNRWEVIITVLSLVSQHLPDLAHEYPDSIDILERTATEFPVAYFLRRDVEDALMRRIVYDVCCSRTWILPLRNCTLEEQNAIRTFISEETVASEILECISALFPDSPGARKSLYLLRGLLVHGILLLCLKKRWNVQYGLHPRRDPMAVPFHAKGVPSDQAEWGHPDVAIIFTCLSFYHQGLDEKQFQQSLRAVLRSDDPSLEYDRWTHASVTLPEQLKHWNIINLDDSSQLMEIWRHLRFTVVAINHFLNNFVFPIHAKQFAIKLQASGWDVPLFSNTNVASKDKCGNRPGITTGFSGTNDNRRLLPLTIQQHDLPGLSHTNAEVLTYLLQPRNRFYEVAIAPDGKRLSEVGLLGYLKGREIRVLIDAGAYILEMGNRALAKAWLQADIQAQAAVYFGPDNKAWVEFREGNTIPLLATPFADNLNDCLVYLDEAHTRGTDLKLPPFARGALTLGLKQTKDQTVQAAMRLRQLGTTQSITFFAPPEVHRSILDVCNKSPNDLIDSADVVTWLLDQTCTTNAELQYLYLAQGVDFCRRTDAAANNPSFLTYFAARQEYLKVLRQPEQQTLEQLYKPRTKKQAGDQVGSEKRGLILSGKVANFIQELRARKGELKDISGQLTSSALEEVEQEREVAFEIEEEREIQRPPRMTALEFPGLSESLKRFISTGLIDDEGFAKASRILQHTELGEKYSIEAFSLLPRLYVSVEFTRTIKLKMGKRNDNFTRSVNWVLFHTKTQTAVVIIPEESEALIPILRSMEAPSVHLILYAPPYTKRMLEFDRLDYYAIPSLPPDWTPPDWLPLELGILAGRLYFDYAGYQTLLHALYLTPESLSPYDESTSQSIQARTKRHLSFLQEWLALRRQGQDVSHTPMGYVCQEWPLRSDHPFFEARRATQVMADAGNRPHSPTADSVDTQGDEFYDSGEDEQIDMFDDAYEETEGSDTVYE
ncbi:hypothetical protein P170DRAFT_510506 [Aspergillus steynii IBT 23096]|uniref:ubiquitinyl hydrolase 1 n=1 Tax=Aspergillus steynii IBT 23096 TaxID=1392250 RepID=A0A2I2G4F4_9EURO|nr:uncharacterized protein P170DRAFT_510506 [Aspergillus steynii IBT 23096]PLB47748.1 hypothetical protein P170DRAFT_510506 [Aspergillus steynii IBT 23096]